MALIFVPQYTLDFDTNAGSDINWELDILRSYDDVNPPPSWINDPVVSLVGTSDPISITWEKDYDVYKPINGSSAKINLLVQNEDQYADFNRAGPYEYQVRLRYQAPNTQYTSIFTSPNTSFTPALVLPTGSQGRQLSLTEANGTVHRFAYLTNGLVRLLAGGLTGTVRLGPVAVATTATVTAAVTVPDQTAGQTITLTGDETGTFSVGDFISPQANNFGAFRGIFVDSITFDGTNTVIVGPSNGATTFNTTSVLRNAGPATEIQGEGGLEEYWCGYITPLDSTEAISTFPYEVSYRATDGLGLLQEKSTRPKTSEDAINPINTVLEGLYETGLDLPVRIDSKIYEGSNDGIISATASANSFYADAKLINTIPVKESIEGYLSPWNCKVYQSNAAWYITNASTHGGTGDLEAADYQEYVVPSGGTAYTGPTASSSENLLYTLNGSSTRDLIPSRNNFKLTTRKPLGSIECRPKDLRELEVAQNGTFEDVTGTTPALWISDPASLETTLVTTTAVRLEGERSLTTRQSVKDLGERADIWFENEIGYTVSAASPIEINIDWLGQLLRTDKDTGGRNVKLAYQVYFKPNNTFTFPLLNYGGLPFYGGVSVSEIFYDFISNEWKPTAFAPLSDKKNLTDYYRELTAEGDDDSQWLNERIEIRPPNEYYDPESKSVFPIETGTFHLRVFYPRTNRVRSDIISLRSEFQDAQIGAVAAYVDNISVKNIFDDEILSPTFERLQLTYNNTETYEPRFASGINSLLTQKLSPTDTYFREGKTETVTLERIATQQKLNDFRGGNTESTTDSSLRYYTSTVINNTGIPVAPKNKIDINYSNYDELTSCIFNGGTFNVKANEFDIAMYVPNQATDIASGDGTITDGIPSAGFYEENIDLIAQTFQGRSNKVVYTLGISITTTNIADGTTVDDGLVPVTMSGEPYLQFTGVPGETRVVNLVFTPATNYISDPLNCDVTTPLPEFATFGSFTNNQGDVILPCEITFPLDSEYEIVTITGSVKEFDPDPIAEPISCSVVITQNIMAGGVRALRNPASTTFNLTGVPGTIQSFSYVAESSLNNAIPPRPAFDLFAGNFDVTFLGSRLVRGWNDSLGEDPLQLSPSSVELKFEYEVPETEEDLPVALIGAASGVSSVTNPPFIYDVTFNTSGDFFDTLEPNNQFQGVEGTVIPYDLLIIPNEGYDLSATNFIYSTGGVDNTLPSGITIRSNTSTGFIQNGEDVILPINVAIGSGAANGTITVTGDAQTEPYSITFNVVTDSGVGFTIDNPSLLQPYGITDFGDTAPDFEFLVSPSAGMMFDTAIAASEQVEVFIDDIALKLESSTFFLVNVTHATGVNVGKIVVDVVYAFPNLNTLTEFPEAANVQVNVRGGATTGGASEAPATGATWGEPTLELPGIGNFIGIPGTVVGRVSVTSNGSWDVKTGAGAVESWITAIQPPVVVEGGVTFFLEELPTGTTTRSATFYIYPDAATAALDTGNNGTGAFTIPNLAGVQVAGSLTITQQDPAVSGLDTVGYSLTGDPITGTIPPQYLGFATYTDGQGTERIIATSTIQTITFCAVEDSERALAGSVVRSSLITCSRGTVSGGGTFSDVSDDSNGIKGSEVFYVDDAPNSMDDDGIYFVRQ